MIQGGKLIGFADALVRIFAVLNILFGAAFALALLTSFPFEAQIVAKIAAKYHGSIDAGLTLWGIRGAMVLAIGVAVAAAAIFRALRAMLATVRAGDPFTAANGDRLATIGWGLLAIQLLDLAYGGVTLWIRHLGADFTTWSPSVGGWLSVLIAFVLARVFAVGAAMRADLDGTV